MNTRIAAAATLAIALILPRHADAQDGPSLGKTGEIIVSAERLFGISYVTTTVNDPTGTTTQTDSRTTIALLTSPLNGTMMYSPYQVPHVAIDVDVASGLTIGGSIGFVSGTGTTKTEASNNTASSSSERDAPSITAFALSPRLGYALSVSSSFVFWPRLGITYYNINASGLSTNISSVTAETTVDGVGMNIEPTLVVIPVPHVGITFTPAIDFPLSGSQLAKGSSGTNSSITMNSETKNDVTCFSLGLHLGMLAYF